MSHKTKISETNPKTGATPAEQTAAEAQKGEGGGAQVSGAVSEAQQLIWNLVQQSVQFCGTNLSNGISFNAKTLTDVLYSNLYTLIGDKISEDEFVQWAAEELVNQGCVIKTDSDGGSSEVQTESTIDTSSYDELVQKIYASIDLLKARKLEVFKLFADINETVTQIGNAGQQHKEASQSSNEENAALIAKRDEQIRKLVAKINGNQENIQKFIDAHNAIKDELNQKIDEAAIKYDDFVASINNKIQEANERVGAVSNRSSNTLGNSGKSDDEQLIVKNPKTETTTIDKPLPQKQLLQEETIKIQKEYIKQPKKYGIGIIPIIIKKKGIDDNKSGNPFSKNMLGKGSEKLFPKVQTKKKPGLGQKIGAAFGRKIGSIKMGIKNKYTNIKNKISNSAVGKLFKQMKKVVSATIKTVKFAAKATWKAAKAFVKVSHAVGKGVVKVGAAVGRGIGKFAKGMMSSLGRKRIVQAIKYFAPAKILTKIGWKAIKFGGKLVWKGIKKLGLKMLSVFGVVFSIGKNFVNKISYYASRLGIGIKNVAYKFLVRPISAILTTIFGVVVQLISSPVKFMKWLITSVMDRMMNLLHNLSSAVVKVLKTTYGIFKKILFNPITMILIIGALFYFFWPKIKEWLSGGLSGMLDTVRFKIVPFFKTMGSVIMQIGTAIGVVFKFVFGIIEWVTNPSNIICRSIMSLIKGYMTIKRWISKLCVKTGKDSIDLLCCFLAGDYIGLALKMAIAGCKWLWKWLNRQTWFKVLKRIIEALVGFPIMWAKLWINFGKALWECCKHPFSIFDILGHLFDPVVEWVGKVKRIFSGYDEDDNPVEVDPLEVAAEKSGAAKNAVRNLKLKGTNSDKVLQKMEQLEQLQGYATDKSVVSRIERMNDNYQFNYEQMIEYNNFLTDAWNIGKGNAQMSARALAEMLESPTISQKLLSAFYYKDAQTGYLKMTRPQAYIEQFLKNIRNMVSDEDIDDEEKFKTLIEAFDQLNKERGVVINQQSDTLVKFSDDITKLDLNDKNSNAKLTEMVQNLNSDLFKDIDIKSSFRAFTSGDGAKTQQLTSVTGDELGTNELLEVKDIIKTPSGKIVGTDENDFNVTVPKKDDNEIVEGFIVPPSMNPGRTEASIEADVNSKRNLKNEWYEHMNKRGAAGATGIYGEADLVKMGLEPISLDEYIARETAAHKKAHPMTPEEIQKEKENKLTRMAALRLGKDIQAYNSVGKKGNWDGFKLGKEPTHLNIAIDGLQQRMLLFSPQWQKVQGTSKITDDELLLMIDSEDKEAAERIRKKKEAEEQKKQEEERQKIREQQILDYAATVKDGYIEVKVGEDYDGMIRAWYTHMGKRAEMAATGKYGEQDLINMGLRAYSQEEWIKYYRKMHGIPEDGIKRIKFEGERKKRNIDWSTRYALSTEEMEKYGIKMSDEGPVMIPLDKAMEVSNSILQAAKTVTSVRDGLEIMSNGLKTEVTNLKKRNAGGMPVVAASNSPSTTNTTDIASPDLSTASEPQQ